MAYKNNIPIPGDFLSISQNDLFNNFAQLDTSFGIDHVTFSDATADNGKHNTVTYPVSAVEPSTAANTVTSFSFKSSDIVGELEFSRGPSDAVSTPLTSLHSVAGGVTINATTTDNILDLTGLSKVIAVLYAFNVGAEQSSTVTMYFDGTTIYYINQQDKKLIWKKAAKVIQLRNDTGVAMTGVNWTIDFKRIT